MSVAVGFHKHDRSASDHRGQRADASAYALLEEARLRRERLRDQTPEGTECAPLKLVHRDLGTAGYLASSRISVGRRGELLAIAHKHATQPVQYTIGALVKTPLCAERALERALPDRLASECVRLAQTHLDDALDRLRRDTAAGVAPDSRRPQRFAEHHLPKQNTGR